jgi:hypothetical protein
MHVKHTCKHAFNISIFTFNIRVRINTNSNIESFNNVLKRDYFERRKVPMRTALNKLIECIVYYSTEFIEFKIQPLIKPSVLKLARGYSKDNYKIVRRNKNLVEYNISGSKYSFMFNSKNYHPHYKILGYNFAVFMTLK